MFYTPIGINQIEFNVPVFVHKANNILPVQEERAIQRKH